MQLEHWLSGVFGFFEIPAWRQSLREAWPPNITCGTSTGHTTRNLTRSGTNEEFSYFCVSASTRFTIEKQAKVRARALVCQEREAILAITQALVDNDGTLSGPEATRVVEDHLSGNTFYLRI